MDDSNNTPDVVDRNQLVGQIFIQPTRTAEFIVLDFVVQPTGAAFPENNRKLNLKKPPFIWGFFVLTEISRFLRLTEKIILDKSQRYLRIILY